jgi:hypothetical protein
MENAGSRAAHRKMHQTTLRFSEDLWSSLEAAAKRGGVSVAQYVRDAALQRLSYEAGRRDELNAAGGEPSAAVPAAPHVGAGVAQERARSEVSQSDALWAQGRLARQRAADLRSRSESARARLGTKKT